MTDFIKLKTGQTTTQIGWTDKAITPHAGLIALAGFFRWQRLEEQIAKCLPFSVVSPRAKPLPQIVLSYVLGILAGGKKLAQLASLRRDTALAQLFGLEGFPSQSTFSRFFQRFSQAANQQFFNPLWKWSLESLPANSSGQILDFDSTQLLHEDAHQKQGVRTGHTAFGFKRCYSPLLATVTAARLVAGFWLRPGNLRSDNNMVAFTRQVFSNLPSYVKIKLVRADSGFYSAEWLALLESMRLSYIVVIPLNPVLKGLIHKQSWKKTSVPGIETAELLYQGSEWSSPRRIVLIRHEVKQRPEAGGKLLFECPEYRYQALVTNLPPSVDGLEIWREYNGRAGMENIIKELDASFGLPELCLKDFWATEAAMSLAVVAFNLSSAFQRFLHWKENFTINTLRFRLFTTGGLISLTNGVKTLKLAVKKGPVRDWWRRVFEKLSSCAPNCIAVESLPP